MKPINKNIVQFYISMKYIVGVNIIKRRKYLNQNIFSIDFTKRLTISLFHNLH